MLTVIKRKSNLASFVQKSNRKNIQYDKVINFHFKTAGSVVKIGKFISRSPNQTLHLLDHLQSISRNTILFKANSQQRCKLLQGFAPLPAAGKNYCTVCTHQIADFPRSLPPPCPAAAPTPLLSANSRCAPRAPCHPQLCQRIRQ